MNPFRYSVCASARRSTFVSLDKQSDKVPIASVRQKDHSVSVTTVYEAAYLCRKVRWLSDAPFYHFVFHVRRIRGQSDPNGEKVEKATSCAI